LRERHLFVIAKLIDFEGMMAMAEKESAMDYKEHENTYALFLGMAKYGTIAIVVILILMAFFLL